MTSWTTWLFLATILLPAALAGCIRPEELPPEPWACDDCCGDCGCWDCGEPAVPTPIPSDCCWSVPPTPACACPPCPPNADCVICGCAEPAPPLLDTFETRRIDACETCRSPAVAASRTSAAMFVATEEALFVIDVDGDRRIPLPAPPIPPSEGWAHSAPSVHVDEQDRVWVATLATFGPARVMMVARFNGQDLGEFVGVDLSHLPALAVVERVHVSDVDGALVAIAVARDAAFAFRSHDDGKSFGSPEVLAPQGGTALFGAPARDAKGNLLVPFAFASTTILSGPAPPPRMLHYASLNDPYGAWSYHGGVGTSPGIAEGSRPSLAAPTSRVSFTFVDATGTLARFEIDGGGPIVWSEPREEAMGMPASAAVALPFESGMYAPMGAVSTAAWWTDEGALRVARIHDWRGMAHQTVVDLDAATAGEAALALRANGRAVTAWIQEGELWIGAEAGNIPAPCAENEHCRSWS